MSDNTVFTQFIENLRGGDAGKDWVEKEKAKLGSSENGTKSKTSSKKKTTH